MATTTIASLLLLAKNPSDFFPVPVTKATKAVSAVQIIMQKEDHGMKKLAQNLLRKLLRSQYLTRAHPHVRTSFGPHP